MTNVEMLARVRTLLDEVTESFWKDTEIYSALTDAQQEVANYFLSLYKAKGGNIPQPLETLILSEVDTTITSGVGKATDYWHLISARYAYTGGLAGTFYPCRVEKINSFKDFNLSNTYLTPSATDPKVYEEYSAGLGLWFLPSPSGTAAYSYVYLINPTAISSTVSPILPVSTHEAIVNYATFRMLMKDQNFQSAQVFLQNYINQINLMSKL